MSERGWEGPVCSDHRSLECSALRWAEGLGQSKGSGRSETQGEAVRLGVPPEGRCSG